MCKSGNAASRLLDKMRAACAVILAITCLHSVSAFSPPVSRNLLLQYQKKWRNRGPQELLDSGYLEKMRKIPPGIRTISGRPGSAVDSLQQEQMMNRWYVAPPGGFQGPAADWGNVGRVPIGPPGSDAAAMNKELSYGPPGRVNSYVAAPPGTVRDDMS